MDTDALLFALLGIMLMLVWGGVAYLAYWYGYGQYNQHDKKD